jgi:CHAT domain-containing protein
VGNPAVDDKSIFAALRENSEASPRAEAASRRGAFSRSSCKDFEQLTWSSLDGAEAEAEELVALWGRVGSSSGMSNPRRSGNVVLLKGREATESALRQHMQTSSVVHLATHGFFVADRCSSALEDKDTVEQVSLAVSWQPSPEPGENPLWLSGLVFAGGNHRGFARPGEDDGILTAQEIAALDLSGVEWAVLSACETGLGEVRAGEGVFGLQRAFQIAGADTVIMSLWSVDDRATHDWMKRLYTARLSEGSSTAESVRQASLSLLHSREMSHPLFWGAFMASGDWR